jgi:transposase
MVHALRVLLRLASGRASDPTAAVLDSRMLHYTPGSSHHAGCDGAKRKEDSKVHAAVDSLGHLLALRATPRGKIPRRWRSSLGRCRRRLGSACGWPTLIGATPGPSRPLRLRRTGFGSRRSSIRERGFAWVARFRRLTKDYERSPAVVAGLHFVAFACLFFQRTIAALGLSS